MLYAFVCDHCGSRKDVLRPVAKRDEPVFCAEHPITPADFAIRLMRREVSAPTVHYKGVGWTRTPSIMKDPIAAGHPQQRHNWGVDVPSEMGDPNAISPYKKVVNEHFGEDVSE